MKNSNYLKELTLSIIMLTIVYSQSCLNANGQFINWWVILKVPPSIGNSGYAYYDSNSMSGVFKFVNKTVDLDVSPLTQTLSLINKDNLQRVAWNDQKPNNTTSSTKAHSKGIIAFGKTSGKGFFIDHSLPKYPAFLDDHKINMTIPKAQQVYGQHLVCFSLSLYQLEKLAFNLLIIHPNIYEQTIILRANTQYLHDLAKSIFPVNHVLFEYYGFKPITGFYLNSIYKNNQLNGSIFEDGMTKWLTSGKVVAETWGRPLQKAWCNQKIAVNNVLFVKINDQIQWDQSKDHSKWALIGDRFSCFGDMNRMSSQWKRGGAFYCLEDKTLNIAMNKIIMYTDLCNTQQQNSQILQKNLIIQQ